MKYKFTTDEVKDFFNYDSAMFANVRWLGSMTAKKDYEITRQYLLEFLHIKHDDIVLEIGCGPGVWTELVSQKCNHITATDIAGKMIEEAKARVKSKNVTFSETDFEKYHSNIIYNKVFSVRVIEYFLDPIKVIKNINRILAPGGTAVIITKTHPTLITLRAKLWNYLKRMRLKKDHEAVPPMKMIPPGRLMDMFSNEGFRKVEVYPVVMRSPFFIHGKYTLPWAGKVINKKYEALNLNFFNACSRKIKMCPQIIRRIFLPLSETYLVVAEK